MANFAVINGDKVVNVIVAETLEDAEINSSAKCIEVSNEPGGPSIGWIYDDATTSFTKPETIN